MESTYVKKICIFLTSLFWLASASAENVSLDIPYNLDKNSLSNSSQTVEIYQVLISGLSSNEVDQNLLPLNEKLRSLNLPIVDINSTELKIEISTSSSFRACLRSIATQT